MNYWFNFCLWFLQMYFLKYKVICGVYFEDKFIAVKLTYSLLQLRKETSNIHIQTDIQDDVFNPHHQSLIEKLEKVQKRATKLVISGKKLHYEERLRRLKLPTLKYRMIT